MFQGETSTSAVDDIRFDRADFGAEPASQRCASCAEPLAESYFEINGAAVCPPCRARVEGPGTQGSAIGRLMRALLAGTGAAAVGAGIYYGVRALTGYEFGLVAIVVGLMVGAGVRWGSRGRGGWGYQALAMALTYVSMVSTYVPAIFQGMREGIAKREAAAAPAPPGEAGYALASTAPVEPATTNAAATPRAGAPVAPGAASSSAATLTVEVPPTARQMVLGVALLAGVVLAAPFLAGFQNVIGWIILGIGLYEAWKLNRKQPLSIAGPFRLAPRQQATPSAP